jgi:hypothetical protein
VPPLEEELLEEELLEEELLDEDVVEELLDDELLDVDVVEELLDEELLEDPDAAMAAPFGVPRPVGPSYPGPAVHRYFAEPEHEPSLPEVTS